MIFNKTNFTTYFLDFMVVNPQILNNKSNQVLLWAIFLTSPKIVIKLSDDMKLISELIY